LQHGQPPSALAPLVADSGEGRWTAHEAIVEVRMGVSGCGNTAFGQTPKCVLNLRWRVATVIRQHR